LKNTKLHFYLVFVCSVHNISIVLFLYCENSSTGHLFFHVSVMYKFHFFPQGCKEEISPFRGDLPYWSAFRSTDYGYMRMQIVNKTHLYTEQISVDKVCIESLLPPHVFCISPQFACKVTYLVSHYVFGDEMPAVCLHLPVIFSATIQTFCL